MKTFNSALLISFFVFFFSEAAHAQSNLPRCQGADAKTWTNCQGSLKFKGATYIGEFQNGMPNGRGEMSMTNGNRYVGGFKDGYFDGIGKFLYANGDFYEGQYVKGKKDGPGIGRVGRGETFDYVFKDDQQISATPKSTTRWGEDQSRSTPRSKTAPPPDPNAAWNVDNWKSSDDLNLLDMVVFLNEKNSAQRIAKDLDGNIVIGNGNEAVRVEVINFPLSPSIYGSNGRVPNVYSIFENRLNPDFVANAAKQDDPRKKFGFSTALLERYLIRLFKDNNIKVSKFDIQFKDNRPSGSASVVIVPKFLLSTQNQAVVQQLKTLLGEEPIFNQSIREFVGEFKNRIGGQELGVFPVVAITEEATRLKEQKIAKQKVEKAIAASFKEKVESAVENKTELAAAISPEIKNVENNICLVEKPVESLTLLGIIETEEFIRWSGFKSADAVSQRLKIFKTANELFDATNNGKCLIIVDYAENMKSYLAAFERDKKTVKYGVAYTRDESLPLLAKARKYESRQDMEAALDFGSNGANPTQYAEFKQLNVVTVEDFKKAVARMNTMKYSAESNPTSEAMLVFLNDEKDGKKSKSTALAVKLAREKKAAAEEAAQKKREAAQAAADRRMALGKCDYNVPGEIYYFIFKNNSATVPFALMPITLYSLIRKNAGYEVNEPRQRAEKKTLLKAGMGSYEGRKLPACVETMKLHLTNRSAAKTETQCYQIAYLADPEFKLYRGVETFECKEADAKLPEWQRKNQVEHLN